MRWDWRKGLRIKKKQKKTTSNAMKMVMREEELPKLPLVITMTRIGPKKLDDDNVTIACKYVRDAIAAIIGVDDGSPLYTWICYDRIGKKYGVDVEITSRGDAL